MNPNEQEAKPALAPSASWPYFYPATMGMRWDYYSYPPYAQQAGYFPGAAPWSAAFANDPRAKQPPLTFVLVHGSWADTSFWDGVAAELRKKGHTVYVPEYPGHGPDPNKAVTHAMISKSVADYITSHNLHGIILVGHSFGGSVVQKVAELVPERIKRLVFWDAFVLPDGQSLADQFPPAMRQGFEQLRAASKDDTIMLPFPAFRDTFVNLAPLDLAQRLYNQVSPEPAKPLFEKLDLKRFYNLELPKSYVYFTDDNAVPQAEGYGWHPHMSSRLGTYRLITGHGDHFSTAKTNPAMLAQKIYEAARD
ncbi:alpha/beta fold hydrolase [Paenibacillus aestuarii]|uniref:Alpha/beta fold hydrolase n=1 Tax=Paenibacillus aestuarii TaxID=516965 RepID=A0ABW0K814_9BACL|nr:alpha/beta fold hydrolase [Paenibacillus aestuarii]